MVAGPHVCESFQMSRLTLAYGLDVYPVLCWCWFLKIGTSSIEWGKLNRLLPEDTDRI